MKRPLLLACVLTACCGISRGIINPNFTPAHLVEQSKEIQAAALTKTDDPARWTLTDARALKGKPAGRAAISLAQCDKDSADSAQRILRDSAGGPVIVFAGAQKEGDRAYMHVGGLWFDLQARQGGWDLLGFARRMDGTYAGGTDMLIRMSEYLVNDPQAGVPVSANVRWMGEPVPVAKGAEVAGLAAVEVGKPNAVHLFVASPAGDRLFKPAETDDQTTFADVTAAAGLDSKSRRFLWLDVNGDGLADLVSWDGQAVSARLSAAGGAFKAAGAGWVFKPEAECIALSACPAGGAIGVLVSTARSPVLLAAGAAGWKQTPLPQAAAAAQPMGRASPCVVADLNGDGFTDLLQPRPQGGLLWAGRAGGLQAPVKSAVAAGAGRAHVAVADFNEDGAVDIFLAGQDRNTLWENDGKGGFRDVFRFGGSISYKCPPGAAAVAAVDLNHDGRPDLCLLYASGDLLYHFNRGFRSFGEEGEVRLPAPAAADAGLPLTPVGQKAMAVGDFNADGSLDLAVASATNEVRCHLNDQYDMPSLRLRLPKGAPGPVTVSCWMGTKFPICIGTVTVAGHSPPTLLPARQAGPVTIKWRLPGGPEQTQKVTVESGPADAILTPSPGNAGGS